VVASGRQDDDLDVGVVIEIIEGLGEMDEEIMGESVPS